VCCLHVVSGPDNFSCEKKKSGFFFGPKKFAGPADPDFLVKPGAAKKFTTEKNSGSQLYTRYPGNYPDTGYVLHTVFQAKNLFCRNFSGTNPVCPYSIRQFAVFGMRVSDIYTIFKTRQK